MTVYIHVKKLGKKTRTVEACPYELHDSPNTLRELICSMVLDGVYSYSERLRQSNPLSILSADELKDMSQVGKIAFGLSYGNKEATTDEAIVTAIKGFEDGLYRFFINDAEITHLDAPLELHEKDSIAIVRLVMLTGGFF